MKIQKKMKFLAIPLLLAVILSACSGKTSKSYTFRVETGDSIKVELDTSEDYDLEQENGRFMVVNGEETVLEGCFITEETYDQYQSIKSNASVEVLKEDKKDENRYFFYKCEGSGGTEYDYVLWIKGSHTGILMGGLEGQEAAESAFERISFSVDTEE
ncbi:MAG: hypothetical protein ACI4DL_07360 [Lachnospiraceae bacterium]